MESIFLVNVFVGSVLIVLIFRKLKGEWREAEEEKFDLTGSVLYSLILFPSCMVFLNYRR